MGLPQPARHYTGEYDSLRMQESLARALRQITGVVPWLDGALLDLEGSPPVEGLAFAAGVARDVPHKLGRRARGVIVLDTIEGTPGLPLRDPTNSNALTMRLTFVAACRVKLWVW